MILDDRQKAGIDLALDMLMQYEGFVPHPYFCSAGHLTIGYGEVIRPNKTYGGISGKDILAGAYRGAVIKKRKTFSELKASFGSLVTKKEAFEELKTLVIKEYYGKISDIIGHLSENKIASAISLCYNIGVRAFRKSTVARRIQSNDLQGAGQAFLMWRNAGKDKGILLPRRQKELAIWERA